MKKITLTLLLCCVFAFSGCGKKQAVAAKPDNDAIYGDFDSMKVWDISPETGFKLSLSKKYVTQGKYSLKVEYPAGGLPSINTKKLKQTYKIYDVFTLDVYNPQQETLPFRVRLDDTARRRFVVNRPLLPGWTKIEIEKTEIAEDINPEYISRVVFFLDDPKKRFTIYFDNLHFEAREGGTLQRERFEEDPDYNVLKAIPTVRKTPPIEVAPKGTLTVPVRFIHNDNGGDILVSTGIPFAPGQLMSAKDIALFDNDTELAIATKVLAHWPKDNAIRSVLVQVALPPWEGERTLTLKWGKKPQKRAVKGIAVIEGVPEGWLELPAKWLCASGIIGKQVPMYQHPYPIYDEHIERQYDPEQNPRFSEIENEIYYDTPHVIYQAYVRSGDTRYFLMGRQRLLKYRQQEMILTGRNKGRFRSRRQTRYVYVEAMVDDYLLTGDERSLMAARMMTDYTTKVFPPKKAFYPKKAHHFWSEREAAFPFLNAVIFYELTGEKKYRKIADEYMANLYRTQVQWPRRGGFIHNLYAHDPEEGARPDEYGGSPFMTGLLLEAVVKYHQVTGSDVAVKSLFMALEWLSRRCLGPAGKSFVYMTCASRIAGGGHADLNLLIAHAFGYGYYISGKEEYRRLGETVFEWGVRHAYLKDTKHFNQNYRSSGLFLGYMYDEWTPAPPPAVSVLRPRTGVYDDAPTVAAERAQEAPATVRHLNALLIAKDILYYNGFERSILPWTAPSGAAVNQERLNVYAEHSALNVSGAAMLGPINWQLAAFPRVSFAYKIPRGLPVGMRITTQFGDRVTIGGTDSFKPGKDDTVTRSYRLIDDNAWHEIDIDAQDAVHKVFGGLDFVMSFEFATSQHTIREDSFLIDEFMIYE